jgi:cytochrome c-type biogenesis protein CcmH
MRTGVLALAALLAAAAGAAVPATQQEIEEALTCQCGCGLTVHACNHLQCPSGEPMKREIAERLARGESKEAILAAFRARYGEKVLSAPTFRGFNWLAWVTPFAAVAAAALTLGVVLGRRTRARPGGEAAAPAAVDPVLRARLVREIEELEREP